MVRQIKAMLYFFATDLRRSFTIFWTILTAIVVVSLVASYQLLPIEESKMYLVVSFTVYVYAGILGFITVKESLPFVLKMGGTRKNYFAGIGVFFLSLSFIMAVLENIYHSLIMVVIDIFDITNFTLFHPVTALGKGDIFIYRFGIDLFIMFFLLTSMFLIGLIFHKYGQLGGLSVLGSLALVLIISAGAGVLTDFVKSFFTETVFSYYVAFFGIGIVCYLLSWLLLHNISAKSARAS